ncbi:olfactory receptor 13G1-like [Callorhinus ursinus]|uniref:Olfactory receptor 13G1-like n=1 Tax=Callorhinus ursinus TaxID=34884 RepID=A0A3Q7Q147_CALUR|nr:olfactory receptor 13G1-like [Callorhinus ursinus]XP_025735982.1 olfactory receptor 13G1-like [Callorhinus ursinus]
MNQTQVIEFLILGFSETPQLQMLFFPAFLLLYMVALSGNLLIMVVIGSSPALHTPMYFFLVNLAMVDILCTSTILPKLLGSMVAKRTISYGGCIVQVFFFTWSLGAELLLFSAMAYDRYVAICWPLHYSTLVDPQVCRLLAMAVWMVSLANTSVNTGLLLRLPFCHSKVVQHFFCEIPPLLKLSCAPTHLNEVMAFTADMILAVGNFSVIMLSYICIIASILRIRSAAGKQRAFSTCSSHLLVVTLYYSTVIYTYIHPASRYSLDKDKVVSVIYTSVAPSLNPLIYSLRNTDVKAALRRLLS